MDLRSSYVVHAVQTHGRHIVDTENESHVEQYVSSYYISYGNDLSSKLEYYSQIGQDATKVCIQRQSAI